MIAELGRAMPQAQVYRYDGWMAENRAAGMEMIGASGSTLAYDLAQADVLVALHADPFYMEAGATQNAARFASRRRLAGDSIEGMNRLYAVEPEFSVTGMAADNRLQLAPSQIGGFLQALASHLFSNGLQAPSGSNAVVSALSGDGEYEGWVEAVAGDLLAHRGSSVIMVGDNQPGWVHALAHLVNVALGNVGETVHVVSDPTAFDAGTIVELAGAIDAGDVETLLVLGGNPAYTAPADLDFASKLGNVANSFHLGYRYDDTAAASGWHLPQTHGLEAWGDLRGVDGTTSIAQPLIAPLYDSHSAIEVLSRAVTGEESSGYDLIRSHWQHEFRGLDFEGSWRQWVHDGVVAAVTPRYLDQGQSYQWSALSSEMTTGDAPTGSAMDVIFRPDHKVYDGRFANNGWLQELPDPVSKLTWDNAALIGPATADAKGIEYGRAVQRTGRQITTMVNVGVNGQTLSMAVFVVPGIAENVVILPLGYGQSELGGVVSEGTGFNTFALRTTEGAYIASGGTLAAASGDLHVGDDAGPPFDGGPPDRSRSNDRRVRRESALRQRPRPDGGPPAQFAVGASKPAGRTAVGYGDRPDNLHRLSRLYDRVPGREQHLGRRQRACASRSRNALDPSRPLLHRRRCERTGSGVPADPVHAVRERSVRASLSGCRDHARSGRHE